MAILLARYRWLFLVVAIASLAEGFYHVLRRSTRHSRTTFWIASALTVVTIAHWGWWRF